jgi:acetamidase/formamidase
MGDAHIAQGDSEFDGTGIETSITGRFKITLHKKGQLPKTLRVRQQQQRQMHQAVTRPGQSCHMQLYKELPAGCTNQCNCMACVLRSSALALAATTVVRHAQLLSWSARQAAAVRLCICATALPALCLPIVCCRT